MNNKEKLYLIKVANRYPGDLDDQGWGTVMRAPAKHTPGSIGAAFQPNNVDYSGKTGPAIGSRAYRALPQEQRQGLVNARDQQQSDAMDMDVFENQSPFAKIDEAGVLPKTMSQLPTAKGGLAQIPPRPAAHPLSSSDSAQTQEALKPYHANTVERMDRGMPVQLHAPYARPMQDPFAGK